MDLRERSKNFALRLFAKLPKTTEAQVLGRQLLRSGTSLGANYREANAVIAVVKLKKRRIGLSCSSRLILRLLTNSPSSVTNAIS